MLWKWNIPMTTFVSPKTVKQRSSHLRTCLANGCTKYMEIKHRCLQREWHSKLLGLIRYNVVLGKDFGDVTFDAQRMCYLYKWACDKTNGELYFHFSPFVPKSKTFIGFLGVNSDSYWCRSFIKMKFLKVNFQKSGDAFRLMSIDICR